jgi:hypothetical protein
VRLVASLALAAWVASTEAVAASRPGCTHAVVAASPHHLDGRLAAAAAAGFHVAAVARPDASAPPRGPVVVLARHADEREPVEIVAVRARDLVELGERVDAAARPGRRLRGVTRIGPGAPAPGNEPWLALLEGPPPPSGVASSASPAALAAAEAAAAATAPRYRFVLSRGDAAEWKRLEAAAAAGYRVVDVSWWPDPSRAALGEVVFVAERSRRARRASSSSSGNLRRSSTASSGSWRRAASAPTSPGRAATTSTC